MTHRLKTVIIPAAGQGTRLLPLTKVLPKELLPVHDRPVLQFALDEAGAAGAERIIIVIHPTKTVIRDYLRPDPLQVARLRQSGKADLASAVATIGVPAGIEVTFVMQDQPLGLGHAVLCAADLVLDGPVGVILPDDVILGEPCLAQMAAAYHDGHMVAAMDVPVDQTQSYGIFVPQGKPVGRSVPVSGMVEKPAIGTAPSTLAAVGRYILDARIMAGLARTSAGHGGEVQLTDAIAADGADLPLTAYRFHGDRFDCGTFAGLLAAGNARAAQAKRLNGGERPPSLRIVATSAIDAGRVPPTDWRNENRA